MSSKRRKKGEKVRQRGGKTRQRYEWADVSSFAELNLSPVVLRALNDMSYERPTAIQAAVIPLAMQGKDISGSAQTGSGKTAAFAIPFVEKLLHRDKRIRATRVLVLSPTRELATQSKVVVDKLVAHTDITTCLAVGGLSNKVQEAAIRQLPDILVATPGRLIDHLRNAPSFDLDSVDVLVLDEADRLLDLGFKDEIEEILKYTPVRRQTLLFSATMSGKVGKLASLSLKRPVRVSVDRTRAIATGIVQEFVRIPRELVVDKEAMLMALCTHTYDSRVVVFFPTKKLTHRVYTLFRLAGARVRELHSGLTQLQRMASLEAFRQGEADLLMCTDLAARGLDIPTVEVVVNYNVPRKLADYIHRVGRTARAGRQGRAVSFIHEENRPILQAIMEASQKKAKKRTLAPAVVAEWRSRLARELEPACLEVLADEKAENELRELERQVRTAENRIKKEEEILARPARTWFLSERQKRAVKERALEAADGSGGTAEGTESHRARGAAKGKGQNGGAAKGKRKLEPYAGMSRKKRRNAQARKEIEKMKRKGQLPGTARDGTSRKKKPGQRAGRQSQ